MSTRCLLVDDDAEIRALLQARASKPSRLSLATDGIFADGVELQLATLTGETVRVNGTARICIEQDVLSLFPMKGVLPKCVIEVSVQAVYFQCARALLRSSLWSKEQLANRPGVPTAGQMLAAVTDGSVGGKVYDDALPQRQADTLY